MYEMQRDMIYFLKVFDVCFRLKRNPQKQTRHHIKFCWYLSAYQKIPMLFFFPTVLWLKQLYQIKILNNWQQMIHLNLARCLILNWTKFIVRGNLKYWTCSWHWNYHFYYAHSQIYVGCSTNSLTVGIACKPSRLISLALVIFT